MKSSTTNIRLDGTLKSSLKWDDELEQARFSVQQGKALFWQLDLGLIHQLRHPLTNPSQFMSLKLSMEHYKNTVWKEFQENTSGISIYNGTVDFSSGYIWDAVQEQNLCGWLEDHFDSIDALNYEISSSFPDFSSLDHHLLSQTEIGHQLIQLYCRDAVAEYFDLLAKELPVELSPSISLKTESITNKIHAANLICKDRFPYVELIQDETKSSTAVCIPSLNLLKPSDYHFFTDILEHRFKIIPETLLTTEWDGLDYLIVPIHILSSQGKRMVQGFCAAGGTVVNLSPPAGLPSEISKEEFFCKINNSYIC